MKLDRLKLHTLWNSLASNVASPFVAYIATKSGASDILIGYVSSIGTLASAVSQLAGGRLADKSGKRVAMAAVFSVVTGALWLAAAFYQGPTFIAIIFTAITLASGFYAAGYTAAVGEASEQTKRGSFLGSFARLTSIGALGGLILITIYAAYSESFSPLFLLSGLFFLISALFLRGVKETVVRGPDGRHQGSDGRLRTYYVVTAVYGVFWGFAWPLFTITLVKVVNMSFFEYSLAQVISVAATIAFQPLVGRLVDRNREGAVFWGRMGLVIYPLTYMFFSSAWEVYAINVVSGVTNALLNVAFLAYLYDISPAGQRGRYSAEFNLVTGMSVVGGSLLGGLALTLISTPDTLWISLAYLYLIAAAGRAGAALLTRRYLRSPKAPVEAMAVVPGAKLA